MTEHSHSTLTLADRLHQYSEWLDGEGLIRGEENGDNRSHDDLVAGFLDHRKKVHPEIAHFGGPMTTPMSDECAVHEHREWVPVNQHHVWPVGLGGPDTPGNRIQVCANGHYAIHEFMRQLILHGGDVPWKLAQHFGSKVRHYARDGWEQAGKPTKGGKTE